MSSNKSLLLSADTVDSNVSINTQQTDDEKSSTSSFSTPRYILLAIFGFAYVISVLVNLRIIQIFCTQLSKRMKRQFSVNMLVAHLSCVCIGIAMISVLGIFRFGLLVEKIADFCTDSLVCAFALNTLLILHERVRTISGLYGNVHLFRNLKVVWSISSGQAVFSKAFSYFKTLQLVNFKLVAKLVGVAFEITRFAIFYLGVGFTILYALYKVLCKLGHLEMPGQRLISKMASMRSFFIHFGTFVIVWISYGIWYAILRCAYCLEYDLPIDSTLIAYTQLGFHAYLALNPPIHIFLLDGRFGYLFRNEYFTREENFDDEIGTGLMDAENNITVNVTPVPVEEAARGSSDTPMTMIRELSRSPIKFGPRSSNPPEQPIMIHGNSGEFEYIDQDSDTESMSDVMEYNAADRQKKVSCTGTEITYYEEDEEDDIEKKDIDVKESEVKYMETFAQFDLSDLEDDEIVI